MKPGTADPASPAELPPQGLPGLDPRWSRLVTAPDPQGVYRTWHVLDTGPPGDEAADEASALTLLCVHGNPTWSYLWRSLAAELGNRSTGRLRVLAVDHLGMGWSERTGRVHRLADRVAELGCVTDALALTGPVVTVGHDWGGSISLGWALEHQDQLAGLVLTNTAVAQPDGARMPPLLGTVRLPGVLRASTVSTSAFVDGTLRLARPALSAEVRSAYRAPYRTAAGRAAVGDFVEDIPLRPGHPSFSTLARLQDRLGELAEVPALLLWGPRDPVFSDRYLRDLQRRLPAASLHRFPDAGHLVVEDAPVALAVGAFVDDLADSSRQAPRESATPPGVPAEPGSSRRPLWEALEHAAGNDHAALVELGRAGVSRSVSWRTLNRRVTELAAGLAALGVQPGARVGLLVPPGADLTACLYACWRAGAVAVIADAGLGLPGLRRALGGAGLDHLIGVERALVAARAMRLPGQYLSAGPLSPVAARGLRVAASLADLARLGRTAPQPVPPAGDAVAAVLFTSGATGPAKGVVYRHRQLEAQRDAVATMLGVTGADRLVAAFAPFALYGPALGITSAVPDMDVTAPATLTASALAAAVAAVDATLVFASPAALRNVVDTADGLRADQIHALASVRCLLSAGAPVPRDTLRRASDLLGGCEAHTPYGMTEVLPVADVTLRELDALDADIDPSASPHQGVCVGRPVRGVDVAVCPLDHEGSATAEPTTAAARTGEILVRAAHVKDHYDQLWLTQRQASRPPGWHRTGDVGHLDTDGRLWVEGRLAHVVGTAQGPVTPVGIEQALERLDFVRRAAAVGVGPPGVQQVVAVVEGAVHEKPRQASLDELDRMRDATGVPLAAALVVDALPVDVRHNSKIDRTALSRWAEHVLSGRPTADP